MPLTKIQSADIVQHIYQETKLHVTYCAGWGISEADMLGHEEKQGMSVPPKSFMGEC